MAAVAVAEGAGEGIVDSNHGFYKFYCISSGETGRKIFFKKTILGLNQFSERELE